MNLRTRLLLLVAVAVIPVIGIEIHSEIELRQSRQEEISREAMRLMRLANSEQERINEGTRQLLVAFSETSSVRFRIWTLCNELAGRVLHRVEGYVNLGVADPDGNLLCSALPVPAGMDVHRAGFFGDMTADGDLLVGGYHIGRIAGKKTITLALPLRDAAGTVTAVAWANLDLDWLAQHFADRFPSPDLTLLIADRAGTILVRLPDNADWVGKTVGEVSMPYVTADKEGVVDAVGVDGERRIIAYSPTGVAPMGLYVGVGLTKAPYFAAIDVAIWQKAVLIALVLALALIAAWLIGSVFIRRPIERLLAVSRRWRAGDYAARAELADKSSEIGKLGRAFDQMAEAVEKREQLRRKADEALTELNLELEERIKTEVAAREKAQAALLQGQKIEAVGQLTSGVAHDFNNLLAAVIGNLDLLRNRVSEPRARQWLEGAFRAATRGAKITEQLLAFSRHRHLEPEAFDANELVRGMGNLFGHTLGPMIGVTRALAPELWPVLADPSQIEVALLNLAINARDAMPLGGTLMIETANLRSGDRRLPSGLAGDFVMLAVSDTGIGMSEEVKSRAFEPFFTTKEIGRGTGLGLSMVYGVAKQSGGAAVIESEAGKGTTIALFLPRASSAAPLATTSEPAAPERTASRRRGRILVVDDDADVRAVTAAALGEVGCEVTAVESGQAAIQLIEHGQPFDFMIVDYAMPGMSGGAVIERARAARPDIGAMLVTGFAGATIAAELPPDVPLLRKPFRTAELVARVTKALGPAGEKRSNVLTLAQPRG